MQIFRAFNCILQRICQKRLLSFHTQTANGLDLLRRKCDYRSRYRGMVETELILRSFNQKHLISLTEPQLCRYMELLEESDPDLMKWLSHPEKVPERLKTDEMFLRLQSYLSNPII